VTAARSKSDLCGFDPDLLPKMIECVSSALGRKLLVRVVGYWDKWPGDLNWRQQGKVLSGLLPVNAFVGSDLEPGESNLLHKSPVHSVSDALPSPNDGGKLS
jgi:hypothetical protein